MEKAEFIQRMSMLKTESNEFIETYLRKIYDCPYLNINYDEKIILRYQGNDIEIVKRLFVKYCDIYFPDFKIEDSNKKVINYLLNMSIFNVDKSGIVIRGNVGSGKTLISLIYINFFQHVFDWKMNCRYYNPITLMTDYMSKGFEIFNYKLGDILFLDDIGISTESSHYGNKINIIEHLIYLRYEQFKTNPHLQTICTTNLIHKDMVSLYGERAISRLNEMTEWNEGILISEDRRKGNPMKEWPKILHYADGVVRFMP